MPDQKTKDRQRAKTLWNNFCLTPDEWDLVNSSQNGVCFFCHKPQKSGKRLATDHDHTTGEVRGILCSVCNRALGVVERAFYGRMEICLARMLEYVQNPPVRRILGRRVLGWPGRINTTRHRYAIRKGKWPPVPFSPK